VRLDQDPQKLTKERSETKGHHEQNTKYKIQSPAIRVLFFVLSILYTLPLLQMKEQDKKTEDTKHQAR
jgi:hypothetical protein